VVGQGVAQGFDLQFTASQKFLWTARHPKGRIMNEQIAVGSYMRTLVKFKRARSLNLWEIVVCNANAGRNPRFTVAAIREYLLGADWRERCNSYENYRAFKRYVLRPALAEIGEVADYKFDLTEFKQDGDVVEVQFTIVPIGHASAA
jgi:plasmid replication initiation protein